MDILILQLPLAWSALAGQLPLAEQVFVVLVARARAVFPRSHGKPTLVKQDNLALSEGKFAG